MTARGGHRPDPGPATSHGRHQPVPGRSDDAARRWQRESGSSPSSAPREGGSVTEVGTRILPRHRLGKSLGRIPRGEGAARQALRGRNSTKPYPREFWASGAICAAGASRRERGMDAADGQPKTRRKEKK